MTKSPMGYDLLEPAGNDNVDIPTLWNAAVANTEALFKQMSGDFDALSLTPGNNTDDTCTTSPEGLDTWITIITSASDEELARKVEKESKQSNGKALWTTTITMKGKPSVTCVDKEKATGDGWVREVK